MAYRVLARKYRPRNLGELVGQDALVESLKNAFATGRIPHALLLRGIRGVGKTTTARIVAKSLNCLGVDGTQTIPSITPCDVCVSCRGVLEDRHMDVVEIDAASNTGVDDMRELTESAKYKAIQGRYKIFIIDEAHMLSKSAFNALLKTLEEPPPHVKFILATTESKKIPDTILSRCARFDLSAIRTESIIERLRGVLSAESLAAEDDALAMLARAADGSMRDALSLLDQAITLEGEAPIKAATVANMLGLSGSEAPFAIYEKLFEGNLNEALAIARDLRERGANPLCLVRDSLDVLYWLICLKREPNLADDASFPLRDRQRGKNLADKLGLDVLLQSWDLTQKAHEDVRLSPCPDQALEVGLIRLALVKEILPPVTSGAGGAGGLSEPTRGGGALAPSSSSASASPIAARATLPRTFEELADSLLSAKEGTLHGHLWHDASLITYEPGKIVCGVNDRVPKNFATALKAACLRVTGVEWVVETTGDTSRPTLARLKEMDLERKRDEALSHPLTRDILRAFPRASVTVH